VEERSLEPRSSFACTFTILVQPEWSLRLRTVLYQQLSDHENVRLLERGYCMRTFKGSDGKSTLYPAPGLEESTPPMVLIVDIGSFLVVSPRHPRYISCL